MDPESRIFTALGKILGNFNFLELNLGLCLRHLESPRDVSASHSYLSRSGMPEVIERLKKRLGECEHIPDITEFSQWMGRAEESRLLRNYYAHATWEYLPLSDEALVSFRIPPWRREMIEESEERRIRVEELEAEASRVEAVFRDFMKIRRKYQI